MLTKRKINAILCVAGVSFLLSMARGEYSLLPRAAGGGWVKLFWMSAAAWFALSAIVKYAVFFGLRFRRLAIVAGCLWMALMAFLAFLVVPYWNDYPSYNDGTFTNALGVIFFFGWPLFDWLAVASKSVIVEDDDVPDDELCG